MAKSITMSDQEYAEYMKYLEEKNKKNKIKSEKKELKNLSTDEIPEDIINILQHYHIDDWDKEYIEIPAGIELKFSNETPFLYVIVEGSVQINAFKYFDNKGTLQYNTIHYVNGFLNKKKYAPVSFRDLSILGTLRFLIKNSVIYDQLSEYHSSAICVTYSTCKLIKLTPTDSSPIDLLTPLINKDTVDIILTNNLSAGIQNLSESKLKFTLMEILLDYEKYLNSNSTEPYILTATLKKFSENIGLNSATDVDRSLELLQKQSVISKPTKEGRFRTFQLNITKDELFSLTGLSSQFEWNILKFSMRPLD